ncbi:MAG TPA: TMEM175 family protein [Marmoricola sp.]|nr:TMEM175 family protein [Marmoricola sp.]
MESSRLQAFSDGVLAVIITVMVLELDVPDRFSWHALGESGLGFLTYLLSFVYVGIYWNNHHHLFHVVDRVDGTVLWANLHLLFWLSLFPFTTDWMAETEFSRTPVVVYGVNLLLAAVAYYVLEQVIFRVPGGSGLRTALGRDLKGKLSPVLYVTGIATAFVSPWLATVIFTAVAYYLVQLATFRLPTVGPRLRQVLGRDVKGRLSPFLYLLGIGLAYLDPWLGQVPYVCVALMWLVPDRRVERYLESVGEERGTVER